MFTSERDLNAAEALLIARAMVKVSASDGVDERERQLIGEFLKDIGTDKSFDDLSKEDFNVEAAKGELEPEVRLMMIEGCWLVAFADGKVTEIEKEIIGKYAAALEEENVETIREQVLDKFIQSLSHIKNIEALAEVTKRLSE